VRTSISQKGLALVLIPLLFQIVFALLVLRLEIEQAEAHRWAAHSKNVIAQGHEIRTQLADAQSAARGYAITLDPATVVPFDRAIERLPDLLSHFDGLVKDNPEQAARAASLHAHVGDYLNWLGSVVALTRAGDGSAALARIRSGPGQAMMNDLGVRVEELLAEEARLDRERMETVQRSRSRLNVLFIIGGIVSILTTLMLAHLFRRGIGRRFLALAELPRRLTAGRELPPPLQGDDEFAELDRAFRGMAAELTRRSDEIRDLYDHSPCGYHSVDPDGTVVSINRTELRWLGYEADDIIGRKRFVDFVSPGSREQYWACFAQVKEHGAASHVEVDLVRRDGTAFPVLLNSSAIRDAEGRYARSRTTLTDLTERKRAESAIRLFADVAKSIPLGLLIFQLDDIDGPPVLRVRSANAGASQLLGVSLDEAVGRPIEEVFPAVPDEQLRRYSAVAASGRTDDLGEFRYGDARVEERWWAVLAFPLPERSVGIAFQDVTKRKQAEAEVHQLNRELEERVRLRTADLEAANRDLALKNGENEMFVYSVSHDLRSPLVNLQGFSRELEKSCGGLAAILADNSVPDSVREGARALLDGKIAKSVGFIKSAVLRLAGIIDALLRLSRAGRVEYRWDSVDIDQVVGQVVAAAQNSISERQATVRLGDLPTVWGDRTAIEQVFGNLFGNALTYLNPGRPGEIEIGCLPPGSPDVPSGFHGFYVRDNGLGIPEGHLQKIFQAFQRAHPGVGSGEGLGLAIVSRIVERHRGRVWVHSKAGEGSTFYITLPTNPDASETA
jgi:PAS domain S-box-containing protein